jgi:hypothetical protein
MKKRIITKHMKRSRRSYKRGLQNMIRFKNARPMSRADRMLFNNSFYGRHR